MPSGTAPAAPSRTASHTVQRDTVEAKGWGVDKASQKTYITCRAGYGLVTREGGGGGAGALPSRGRPHPPTHIRNIVLRGKTKLWEHKQAKL